VSLFAKRLLCPAGTLRSVTQLSAAADPGINRAGGGGGGGPLAPGPGSKRWAAGATTPIKARGLRTLLDQLQEPPARSKRVSNLVLLKLGRALVLVRPLLARRQLLAGCQPGPAPGLAR